MNNTLTYEFKAGATDMKTNIISILKQNSGIQTFKLLRRRCGPSLESKKVEKSNLSKLQQRATVLF